MLVGLGPDLDPNSLTLMVFLKECFEKVILKKVSNDNKSMKNYSACKELKQTTYNSVILNTLGLGLLS